MQTFTLNGDWELRQAGSGDAIPAVVPGCVHTDLLASGQLEDPFFRDNELKQMWVGETDWLYRRTFTIDAALLSHDRVLLRCEGLDTLATIRVNDVEIGRADNMFRTYEFDVKAQLTPGENRISVFFEAPATYARRMDAEKGEMAGWVEPMRINSGAWIRKEPCNFGWDWGPKMVTSGIWRDITLLAYDGARLSEVQVLQGHSPAQVQLTINVGAEVVRAGTYSAAIQVRLGDDVVATAQAALEDGAARAIVALTDPQLWWPNGMGAQPLYTVEVTLNSEGAALDSITHDIGLRTLTLERHADEWGESFAFACNGVPFFAKGANWIPASPYPAAATPELYAQLVKAAADANMNMLRVWGGGIYEDDVFYDLCDRYGITIWQDFIFACGTYPSFDADFMTNVRAEAEDNVRRLRHHACIALWCGNNEIEQAMPFSPGWQTSMSWEHYDLLFEGLLPGITQSLDPQRAYWPGSPHNPCEDRNRGLTQDCGDNHLWAVWHGKEPFEWYRTRNDRFVSEFGFQSFPEPPTVHEFTEPGDRNITSYVMEHHQRSGIGNSTIIHYMLDWFRLPTSFESTIWLSQILQGMAMKYAVEHWRRNMPRTMGTLYWQHNDMWPAPSWSSLDWKGNWKALHYMAKRFYAPLLVSGLEHPENGSVDIHVTSDLGTAQAGTARWTVTDTGGTTLEQGSVPVTAAPRADTAVTTLNIAPHLEAQGARGLLVWLELWVDEARVSSNLVLFSRPKHLDLVQPGIAVSIAAVDGRSFDVTLTAAHPALYVWLELAGASFSDGFMDLMPGQPVTVRVTTAGDTSADALRSALQVKSLVDTY